MLFATVSIAFWWQPILRPEDLMFHILNVLSIMICLQCPEDYIHLIGRKARASAKGAALCFITPADQKKWNAICRLIAPNCKTESKLKNRFKKKNTANKRSKTPSF